MSEVQAPSTEPPESGEDPVAQPVQVVEDPLPDPGEEPPPGDLLVDASDDEEARRDRLPPDQPEVRPPGEVDSEEGSPGRASHLQADSDKVDGEPPAAGVAPRPSDNAEQPQAPPGLGAQAAEGETAAVNSGTVSTNVEGDATSVFSIGTVSQFVLKAESDPPAPRPPEDPTTEWPARPSELVPVLKPEQVEQWARTVLSKRVGLLVCPDGRLLQAATYDLLEHADLRRIEHRWIDLSGPRHEVVARLCSLDLLTAVPVGAGGGAAVVVQVGSSVLDGRGNGDEEGEPRRFFLDSFFDLSTRFGKARDYLAGRQRVVFCLVNSQPLFQRVRNRRRALLREHKEDPFLFEYVPFLPAHLRRFFSDAKSRELEGLITEQWQAGLWGQEDDPFDLYDRLEELLAQGGEELEQRVRELAEPASSDDSPAAEEAARKGRAGRAAKLFDQAGPVHRTLLFTAATFPKLSPTESRQLLGILIAGRSVEVTVAMEELAADGQVQTVKRPQLRPLAEIWSEQPDRILAECALAVVTLPNGREVIDFEEGYLRAALAFHLRRRYPLLLRELFDRIYQAGFIFRPEVSPALAQSAIRFTAAMVASEPGSFRRTWLAEALGGMQALLAIELPGAPTPAQLLEALRQLHQRNDLYRLFLGRLAELLREMLDYELLQPLVRETLGSLLENREHAGALHLVCDLARRLRFAPQFDPLFWLRRLIEESPPEVAHRTYLAVFRLVRESGPSIYQLLTPISEWLPDREPDKRPRSRAAIYALRLMLEYPRESLRRSDCSRWGAWPSPDPLFASLAGDTEAQEARLGMLVRWLLHPAQRFVVGDDEPEQALWALRAHVIETWVGILRGLGGDPHAEAARVARALLARVIEESTRREQERLLASWRAIRQVYGAFLSRTPLRPEQPRQEVHARRNLSIALDREFQALRREALSRGLQGAPAS